ncbi:hypothetical protein pb186bvf_008514 [Paramecium bursaria]
MYMIRSSLYFFNEFSYIQQIINNTNFILLNLSALHTILTVIGLAYILIIHMEPYFIITEILLILAAIFLCYLTIIRSTIKIDCSPIVFEILILANIIYLSSLSQVKNSNIMLIYGYILGKQSSHIQYNIDKIIRSQYKKLSSTIMNLGLVIIAIITNISNDEYWHVIFIVMMLIVVTIITVCKSFAKLSQKALSPKQLDQSTSNKIPEPIQQNQLEVQAEANLDYLICSVSRNNRQIKHNQMNDSLRKFLLKNKIEIDFLFQRIFPIALNMKEESLLKNEIIIQEEYNLYKRIQYIYEELDEENKSKYKRQPSKLSKFSRQGGQTLKIEDISGIQSVSESNRRLSSKQDIRGVSQAGNMSFIAPNGENEGTGSLGTLLQLFGSMDNSVQLNGATNQNKRKYFAVLNLDDKPIYVTVSILLPDYGTNEDTYVLIQNTHKQIKYQIDYYEYKMKLDLCQRQLIKSSKLVDDLMKTINDIIKGPRNNVDNTQGSLNDLPDVKILNKINSFLLLQHMSNYNLFYIQQDIKNIRIRDTQVDLRILLDQIIRRLENDPRCIRNQITINIKSFTQYPHIKSDVLLLKNIFFNLLLNVIQLYKEPTTENNTIDIELRETDGEGIEVSIQDKAGGINPSELDFNNSNHFKKAQESIKISQDMLVYRKSFHCYHNPIGQEFNDNQVQIRIQGEDRQLRFNYQRASSFQGFQVGLIKQLVLKWKNRASLIIILFEFIKEQFQNSLSGTQDNKYPKNYYQKNQKKTNKQLSSSKSKKCHQSTSKCGNQKITIAKKNQQKQVKHKRVQRPVFLTNQCSKSVQYHSLIEIFIQSEDEEKKEIKAIQIQKIAKIFKRPRKQYPGKSCCRYLIQNAISNMEKCELPEAFKQHYKGIRYQISGFKTLKQELLVLQGDEGAVADRKTLFREYLINFLETRCITDCILSNILYPQQQEEEHQGVHQLQEQGHVNLNQIPLNMELGLISTTIPPSIPPTVMK